MNAPDTRRMYSDSIAGYVTNYDPAHDRFGLRTSDGREFTIHLNGFLSSEIVRNLGDGPRDTGEATRDMLAEGRYVFVYGLFYRWDGGERIEARQITFPETSRGNYVFEHPNWWVQQAAEIADFYLRGHFPDGPDKDGRYDWRNFRTRLTLSGTHVPDFTGEDVRQETDTISRLVYGLATAFLLTGEERFLSAAESGTEYLREHMRVADDSEGVVYWYHGIDITEAGQRKVYASEFGDDFDAIPMYEQIYALAGPTQTYRITGDPRILDDIDRTVALFERFFRDEDQGGFFSHLDPITMDPRADSLGRNRSRKNWNSIGDHAPAYLINAYLATGREDFSKLLEETADTIAERFPDEPASPFVQERFHADWSADRTWGWQQNRAVVGHNLKIAWNLTRIRALHDKERYSELAERIAELMPPVGSDQQRGGWYDVVERVADPDTGAHHLVWHDRKAWWQQEQAILAYLILAGVSGDPEHRRLARESAAFYNANFLDYDDGGVYFNVLANGIPYLLGTERLKGSHSMAGYHALELCYLAAAYTGLLITSAPLTLHFRPQPGAFPDRLLRVSPDLLPAGSVQIDRVWIDDEPYEDFDPKQLTVRLPLSNRPLKVRVDVEPADMRLRVSSDFDGKTAHIHCEGVIDREELEKFRRCLTEALSVEPRRVEFHLCKVTEIGRPAINELLFQRAKMGLEVDFVIVGCSLPEVTQALLATDAFLVDDDRTCVTD
ncbi:AGE family epimerase/isomerase [Kitasatospora sp. CB01950]|uniref:AGE family epimerase/isomerase n=1 Tax=Kitasatospora sp. CB01950 TaxID=1703930 RepID=UPI00093CBB99|nr:AGE family epimerase/isomerase [Kitasatospora sp. CB01950]OKJ11717.1 N-acyl-D-glucosamine 2-epimerase [Kitasatospora sp. CB01950]